MIYRFHTSDKAEALRMMKAVDIYGVVYDFDIWLRARIKYEDRDDLQFVREELWRLMNEAGINFDCEYE